MSKYVIEYKFNGKERRVKRVANDATEAIKRLVNQYGWSWQLKMVDADTRGSEWCSAMVDPDGGINYSMRIVSYLETEEGSNHG